MHALAGFAAAAAAATPPSRTAVTDAVPHAGVAEGAWGNRSRPSWLADRRYVRVADQKYEGPEEREVGGFRLLSWNVLAETFVDFPSWSSEMHSDLKWIRRIRLLLREIRLHRPDVILLQEVDRQAFEEDFEPRLFAWGFHGLISTSISMPLGVAIFFREQRFRLEAAVEADFAKPNYSKWSDLLQSKLSEHQRTRFTLPMPHSALFVLLSLKLPGGGAAGRHGILFGTVHLPSTVHTWPSRVDVQTLKALLFMEALNVVMYQHEERADPFDSLGTIVAGDLNSPPRYSNEVFTRLAGVIRDTAAADEDMPADSDPEACRQRAKSGDCLKEPVLGLTDCPRSCGPLIYGHPDHRDRVCMLQASRGHCVNHLQAMLARCAGTCKGPGGETLRAPPPPPDPPEGPFIPSPVYELFTRGSLSSESMGFLLTSIRASGLPPSDLMTQDVLAIFQADYPQRALRSAHMQALGYEPETCQGEVLDYILYSTGNRHRLPRLGRAPNRNGRLLLRGVLQPPDVGDLGIEAIRAHGSDHVPLVADFALRVSGLPPDLVLPGLAGAEAAADEDSGARRGALERRVRDLTSELDRARAEMRAQSQRWRAEEQRLQQELEQVQAVQSACSRLPSQPTAAQSAAPATTQPAGVRVEVPPASLAPASCEAVALSLALAVCLAAALVAALAALAVLMSLRATRGPSALSALLGLGLAAVAPPLAASVWAAARVLDPSAARGCFAALR